MSSQGRTSKRDRNVEKWKATTKLWDAEADRFWSRNNIFLIVNSALLVVISSFVEKSIIWMCISVFGLLFSTFWFKVNVMGKYYLDRWKPILAKLEKDDEINIFGHELPEARRTFTAPQQYKSSSTYMRYVAILFGVIWGILLAYGICTFIISAITGDPANNIHP